MFISNITFVFRNLKILQSFLESLDVYSINGNDELLRTMDSLLTMLTNNLKKITGIFNPLCCKHKIYHRRTLAMQKMCVIVIAQEI